MPSVNKVILIGHLGRDPEIRYLPTGAGVCNFSLATSESWKDKNTSERQQRTEWHNIEVWGPSAEWCGKNLLKGDAVFIEGAIRTETWEKDGEKKYKTKIRATSVQRLSGKTKEQAEEPRPAQKQGSFLKEDQTDEDEYPF